MSNVPSDKTTKLERRRKKNKKRAGPEGLLKKSLCRNFEWKRDERHPASRLVPAYLDTSTFHVHSGPGKLCRANCCCPLWKLAVQWAGFRCCHAKHGNGNHAIIKCRDVDVDLGFACQEWEGQFFFKTSKENDMKAEKDKCFKVYFPT